MEILHYLDRMIEAQHILEPILIKADENPDVIPASTTLPMPEIFALAPPPEDSDINTTTGTATTEERPP